MTLGPDDIKRAREIIAAASPAPWHACGGDAFIAAARTGWLASLDEVERMREAVEGLRDVHIGESVAREGCREAGVRIASLEKERDEARQLAADNFAEAERVRADRDKLRDLLRRAGRFAKHHLDCTASVSAQWEYTLHPQRWSKDADESAFVWVPCDDRPGTDDAGRSPPDARVRMKQQPCSCGVDKLRADIAIALNMEMVCDANRGAAGMG